MTVSRVAAYHKKHHPTVIGGDSGGTWLRLAVYKGGQKISDTLKVPMEGVASQDQLAEAIANGANQLKDTYSARALGIGLPCPVDAKGEPQLTPPNLSFSLQGIMAKISREANLPARAFNDGSAAVWGSAMFDQTEAESVMWHGLGTGYGTAVVSGRRELLSTALEGGHISIVSPFDQTTRQCGCGMKGCAEAYVSGSAIGKRYTDLKAMPRKVFSGADVGRLFEEKDDLARSVVDEAMTYLAMALVSYHHIFFADQHVLGGGVAALGQPLLDILRGKISSLEPTNYIPSPADFADSIVLTKLEGDAGIIGAAYLAEQLIEQPIPRIRV